MTVVEVRYGRPEGDFYAEQHEAFERALAEQGIDAVRRGPRLEALDIEAFDVAITLGEYALELGHEAIVAAIGVAVGRALSGGRRGQDGPRRRVGILDHHGRVIARVDVPDDESE